jgi:hypothetical protein
VSNGDCNNLLSLGRQSPIGEDGLVKRIKGRVHKLRSSALKARKRNGVKNARKISA